LLLDLSDSL